jgi:hypothetical protein
VSSAHTSAEMTKRLAENLRVADMDTEVQEARRNGAAALLLLLIHSQMDKQPRFTLRTTRQMLDLMEEYKLIKVVG